MTAARQQETGEWTEEMKKTSANDIGFQAFCLKYAIEDLKERDDVFLLKIARELLIQVEKNMTKEEKEIKENGK